PFRPSSIMRLTAFTPPPPTPTTLMSARLLLGVVIRGASTFRSWNFWSVNEEIDALFPSLTRPLYFSCSFRRVSLPSSFGLELLTCGYARPLAYGDIRVG